MFKKKQKLQWLPFSSRIKAVWPPFTSWVLFHFFLHSPPFTSLATVGFLLFCKDTVPLLPTSGRYTCFTLCQNALLSDIYSMYSFTSSIVQVPTGTSYFQMVLSLATLSKNAMTSPFPQETSLSPCPALFFFCHHLTYILLVYLFNCLSSPFWSVLFTAVALATTTVSDKGTQIFVE